MLVDIRIPIGLASLEFLFSAPRDLAYAYTWAKIDMVGVQGETWYKEQEKPKHINLPRLFYYLFLSFPNY
jgi:hypothetical protein